MSTRPHYCLESYNLYFYQPEMILFYLTFTAISAVRRTNMPHSPIRTISTEMRNNVENVNQDDQRYFLHYHNVFESHLKKNLLWISCFSWLVESRRINSQMTILGSRAATEIK